ncbi:hypothetical protein MPTA5024_17365 [Microbispora sp. ATCC PTA-5024]|nr:hypothetical protein MPTA5024_17365 [Microbispora sp. ATCC PTA-5024]
MAAWVGGAVAGAGCVVAGVLLVRAGLDDADKWASVIGMCIAAAGLPPAVYSIVLARRSLTTPPPTQVSAQPAAQPGHTVGGHVVSGSTIEGDNIQIGRARDVDIRRER